MNLIVTSDKIDLNTECGDCSSCNSHCCTDDVMFSQSDINLIRDNYSIRFQTSPVKTMPGFFRLRKRKSTNGKCIFIYNNKCMIYEHRPSICKEYGLKKYILCPFAGMDSIPTDPLIIEELNIEAKKKSMNFITANYHNLNVGE